MKPERAEERRTTPRVPLLPQAEAGPHGQPRLGRARNIKSGGFLLDTPDTLEEGTMVLLRFPLPPARVPIEAAGRVIRSQPGRSMAIAFLRLPRRQQERIAAYVGKLTAIPEELRLWSPGVRFSLRRSGRLAWRLALLLGWFDEEGRTLQEAAETQHVSRHGVEVYPFTRLESGTLVRLQAPEVGRETLARVVWSAAAASAGRTEMDLEFLGTENFWGLSFPPDRLEPREFAQPTRRRSARLPRRVDVLLNW